jgi:hypothetical protein
VLKREHTDSNQFTNPSTRQASVLKFPDHGRFVTDQSLLDPEVFLAQQDQMHVLN